MSDHPDLNTSDLDEQDEQDERFLSRQELVKHFLRGTSMPCPACGENLRDVDRPRCPKCDRRLTLALSLEQPHLWAWGTLVAVLWAAGGAGVICLAAYFDAIFLDGELPQLDSVWATRASRGAMLFCIAALGAGVGALTGARSFLDQSVFRQWLVASVVIVLTIAAYLTLLITWPLGGQDMAITVSQAAP